MVKIILDAGHGGADTGFTYDQRMEKDDVLNLTLMVGDILTSNGIEVIYTRVIDKNMPIEERVNLILQQGADLIISFHRLMYSEPNSLSGVEAIIDARYMLDEIVVNTARDILDNLEIVGYQNLGLLGGATNAELISEINTPGILLFVGFIDSTYDNTLFDTRFTETALAIASGILEGFGLETTSSNKTYSYKVQVGLFSEYNNAQNLQTQLLQLGYQAEIGRQGDYYTVQVGNFDNLDAAVVLEQNLRSQGYDTLIVAL